MRRALLCVASLVLMATAALAAPIADSVAFQGRLLDAADTPIDGSRDMLFSLWSDSTGGTQLFSELQVVQVSNGLFAICLGCGSSSFFDVFVADDLWLQVQIAGQAPMAPRTRLRNSPRSLTSARVLGDISTSPNSVAIGDLNGDGRLDLRVMPETTKVSLRKSTVSGLIESSLNLVDDRNLLGLKTYQPGQPQYGNITFETSESHTTNYLDCDDDGDGLSDSRVTMSAGGGGGGAGGLMLIEADLDGDGHAERKFQTLSNASKARHEAIADLDDDGLPDIVCAAEAKTDSGSFVVQARDQFDNIRSCELTATGGAGAGGKLKISVDLDGDGVIDNSIGGDCDDTDAEFLVAHELTHVVQQRASAGSASVRLSGDLDADGTPEAIVSNDCDDLDASVTVDYTGGGGGGGSVLAEARTAGASLAIKTKGTGAQRSVTTQADDVSSSVAVVADLDGDGLADRSITSDCDDTDASFAMEHAGGGGGGGGSGGSVLMDARTSGASLAIKTKGTGAQRVTATADDDSASIAIDEPGVHVAMTSKGWDGTIKGRVCVTDGSTLKVDFDGDGDGYVSSRFGIGVLDPANPLEHSSGAHLTIGGVWTNASDANLKENFESVNGEELLEQIEELPISKWNYKSEPDKVTHIGPTAQDFQKVFGVGQDDKSISTIDPSGIALAAIKELSKQNRELKDQNAEMKKQLNELMKKVEKLGSGK